MSKVAIVTGGARGIGLATVRKFLDLGHRVAIVDWDKGALDEVSNQLPDVLALNKDVSCEADVQEIASQVVAAFGGIDILVNNAGVAEFGPIEDTSFEQWRRVMDTNLDGVFLLSQAAVPYLKIDGGAILNIASISGLRASTLRVAYGTSKAAVMQLTQQQAVELGEFCIRANCVAPGPVRTKLAMAVHTQEIIDAYHDALPLNRYGSEQEIANAIAFLCSEEASFVTGQTLAVDGGFECAGVGLPALRT